MTAPFRLYPMISGIQFFIPLVSIRIKSCGCFFVVKYKAQCMLVVSGFELIFCFSYVSILFFRGFLSDSYLVYHSLLEALTFERAGFFIPAVESFSLFFFVKLRTVLLLLEIVCFIFCMQLQLSFTVFYLIFCAPCLLGNTCVGVQKTFFQNWW